MEGRTMLSLAALITILIGAAIAMMCFIYAHKRDSKLDPFIPLSLGILIFSVSVMLSDTIANFIVQYSLYAIILYTAYIMYCVERLIKTT